MQRGSEAIAKTLRDWNNLRAKLELWAIEEGEKKWREGLEVTISPDEASVQIGWYWPGGGITRIHDFHYSSLVNQETFRETMDRVFPKG
jgi:hypothetical protein